MNEPNFIIYLRHATNNYVWTKHGWVSANIVIEYRQHYLHTVATFKTYKEAHSYMRKYCCFSDGADQIMVLFTPEIRLIHKIIKFGDNV